MKILIHLAHPAQYHMYKYMINNLKKKGHHIKVTINTKDILEDLLVADKVEFENILPVRRKKNTKWAALLTLIKKDFKIFILQWRQNFDMMVGTETALSHIGWLFRKPVFIMDEDDVHVIPEAAKLSFPFAKYIVSPESCDLGKFTKKKIAYKGYQKTCYLHPNYFSPNEEIVRENLGKDEKYFFIRVSSLSAYHDNGNNGFTIDILRKIITMLKPYGRILLSTEKELPIDLSAYIFNTDITQIHHFLYYADMLIADSQSMCVEAAILGTPSIRYSDFAGKIGVLEELEHKYDLTYGIPVKDVDKLFNKIDELILIENIRLVWQKKRFKMLDDKIDVTSFWTWLIDSYPSSVSTLKNNPNYQEIFKN